MTGHACCLAFEKVGITLVTFKAFSFVFIKGGLKHLNHNITSYLRKPLLWAEELVLSVKGLLHKLEFLTPQHPHNIM